MIKISFLNKLPEGGRCPGVCMTHKVLPTITYESMDNQAPRASVEVWLVSTRPQKKEAIEEQHVHTGIMKKKK